MTVPTFRVTCEDRGNCWVARVLRNGALAAISMSRGSANEAINNAIAEARTARRSRYTRLASHATQDYVNRVVLHMRAQGRPAVNEEGRCVNVALDGAMCAVACVFPADLAMVTPNVELQERLVRSGVEIEVIEAARRAHDFSRRADFVAAFEDALRASPMLGRYTIPSAS